MTKKLKKELIKILVSICIFVCGIVFGEILDFTVGGYICFVIAYVIVGYEILWTACRNISKGQVFDENFLMMIASIGAFAIGEVTEAVAVMILYQVGEWFQDYAVGKSRNSIKELMEIRPDYANLLKDGVEEEVDPYEVSIGDIILIKPGEKVPLDGIVVEGSSFVDTVALTGESVPQRISVDDEILSCSVNTQGMLKVKVTKDFEDSTVSKILDMVENASNKKARSENFITKFAKYYTPIVVISAVLLAFIPWLCGSDLGLMEWIRRACMFLVISCPCALVISVPLSFFGGIGGAAKSGILIKGSNYIESLSKIKTIVFDKTGTLTKGDFQVQKIYVNDKMNFTEEDLMSIVASVEQFSNHPIAKSIVTYAESHNITLQRSVDNVREISGEGIVADVLRKEMFVGNSKLLDEYGVNFSKVEDIGTIVYLAEKENYLGYVLVADTLKDDSQLAIKTLKNIGIKKSIMLTGDKIEIATKVADEIGIDEVHAQLLPQDKVAILEQILNEMNVEMQNDTVAFVGDGINDAPVITRADVGFAMGALGSAGAVEAADVVLMDDKVINVSKAIQIAKKTMRIVKENIVFAIGIKAFFLVLGAFGIANLWEAVFADVGVTFIAVLNAMRTLKIK